MPIIDIHHMTLGTTILPHEVTVYVEEGIAVRTEYMLHDDDETPDHEPDITIVEEHTADNPDRYIGQTPQQLYKLGFVVISHDGKWEPETVDY